jgi:hypothetical protein
VVETASRATEVRHIRLRPGRHELRLFDLASHPIAELLGLRVERARSGSRHHVHAHSFLALDINFDFVVDPGRVVFDVLEGRARADLIDQRSPERTRAG